MTFKPAKSYLLLAGQIFLIHMLLISCEDKNVRQFDFEELGFPIQNPSEIERLAAFGIPNWSGTEPHNGIDLILYQNLVSTTILSPTNGVVKRIKISENPYSNPANQLLLTIEIYVNDDWQINLVFEPSTNSDEIKTAQRNAIDVEINEEISIGQEVGKLLVGEHGYPHLHYMVVHNKQEVCAYNFSLMSAKLIFEEIAEKTDSQVCFSD